MLDEEYKEIKSGNVSLKCKKLSDDSMACVLTNEKTGSKSHITIREGTEIKSVGIEILKGKTAEMSI